MRTSKVTIDGKEYLTCFSTRVLVVLEEREGNADEGLKRIMSGGKTSDAFWLLTQMIDAGDRYAKLEGLDNPGKLTLDELYDRVDVNEYADMFRAVIETAMNGTKATIEVKPSKNANATPEE